MRAARRLARHQQRGAIGLMAAGTLGLLILLLVLVIDSGRLFLERRDLQRVADLAALEAASFGGLCAPEGQRSHAAVQTLARNSAQRHGFDLSAPARQLSAQLGSVAQTADGHRYLSTSADSLDDAVEVKVSHRVPSSIIANIAALLPGSTLESEVAIQAQAVAQRSAVASFSLSSGLLNLNSGQSPLLNPILNGLLDSDVNLSALTPAGIAAANVDLLSFLQLLQAEAKIGTLDELLDTRIGLLPYVEVIAQLLTQKNIAGAHLNGAKLLNVGAVGVTLGELLGLESGTAREALKAKVNLFDLLLVGAFVANDQNAVDLTLNVPNLASAQLQIIEPPKLAYGPPGKNPQGEWRTEASTGQLALALKVTPSISNILPGVGYLVDLDVNLGLRIGLAEAQAQLKSIDCSVPIQVQVETQTQSDNVRLSSADDPTQPATIKVTILSLPIINITVPLQTTLLAQSAETLTFQVTNSFDAQGQVFQRFDENPQKLSAGGNLSVQLPTLSSANIAVLYDPNTACKPSILNLWCVVDGIAQGVIKPLIDGILLGVGGILGLANQVLASLSALIIQPLLTALGIELGIAEVTLIRVHAAPAQLVR